MLTKVHESHAIKMRYITVSGLMAAMILIMTAYIGHIPLGANGGYIHFGDSLIYVTAAMLPTPYALAAAAIGGGLADLMTAPAWTFATIIIKMLITIPFSSKSVKIITVRNVLATVIACFITVICYFAAGYVLFGDWSACIAVVLGNIIQAVGSAVFFIVFGITLDKIHIKTLLNIKGTGTM